MPLYSIDNKKLKPVKEVRLDSERELQLFIQENLETVFNLEFVREEYQLKNLRIDTLAFDKESRSFVIIEYKKDKSFSIIDQGYAYLSLVLNNQADFILEYNEKKGTYLKRTDIDWSQTRVMFIANNFTRHQIEAINFNDLPMDLWEVKKYTNNTILMDQIKASEHSQSIKTITKGKIIESIATQLKTYTVDDHFKSEWIESRKLYEDLSERILSLDSRIKESVSKSYIGYKIDASLMVVIKAYRSKIGLELLRVKPSDLKDVEKRTKYQKNSFQYYNKHVTDFPIKKAADMDYAMYLIKQVYVKFFK